MPDLIPFPYPPAGGEDFIDPIGFLTDVMPAYSRKEQRVALRGFPGGTIEFTVAQGDPTRLAAINGYLWAHHADLFLIPLWPHAVYTASPLSGGDHLIPCVPPAAGYGLEIVPFQIAPSHAHPWLMVYTSPDNYQVFQFDSLAIDHGGWGRTWGRYWGRATQTSPPAINTIGAVQGVGGGGWGRAWGRHWGNAVASDDPFPAGALVVPMRSAYLDEDLAESLESLEAAAGELRFIIAETAD
jgi:hypothetical protein